MTNPKPTHLFISCAVEDVPLAQWLARKLAARGYPVWFDKMKSVAGEPWPHTVREALKYRTFRMLAVISERSLRKKRNVAERTVAMRIGQHQKTPDFVIALSSDGTELGPPLPSKSHISFANGWIGGWKGLIKKLDSIKAPRTLKNGENLAAASFAAGNNLIRRTPERLLTNLIRIKSFPDTLRIFQAADSMDAKQWEVLGNAWTFYEIAKDALVALIPPPPEFSGRIRPTDKQLLWLESERFRNVRVRDIAGNLVLMALSRRLIQTGCLKYPGGIIKGTFYLPETFSDGGELIFPDADGKNLRLAIRGKIAFRRAAGVIENNFHHFAFRLRLARGLDKSFYVQVTPTLVFFNEDGELIPDDRALLSRLRRVTKTWDNAECLRRVLAVENILSNSSPAGVNDPVLERGLLTMNSPMGLDESIIAKGDGNQELPEELELEEPDREETSE